MSERPKDSSDGLMKAAGFVVMAIVAAGVVAGLTRGRPARTSKSPLAKGSTPPRHVRGVGRDQPQAVEPSARFELQRADRRDDGSLVILGFTHNDSEVAVNPPKIRVLFRDAKGAEIHREETRWPFDMGPGVKVPTRLVYTRTPPYESLDFEVEVSARVGLPAAAGLVAEGVDSDAGKASWTLRGRAANRGEASARWLKVVAAAYGAQGELLWVGTRSLDSDELAPGQAVPFEIRVFRADVAVDNPRFEVLVFGRER